MKKTILIFLLFVMVMTLNSCGGGGGGATGGGDVNNPPPNGFVLTLTPLVSSMPANTLGFPIFVGSPFITQLDVRVRFADGQTAPDGTIVNLTTNNVNVAFLSVPDDPDTTDVNEFTTIWVTQSDETAGGIATFFLHSGSTTGTAVYTASATSENRTYTGALNFNITEGPDPTVQQLTVVAPRTRLPVNDQNIPFFNGTPFMMEADIQFRDIFGNFTNPASDDDGISVVGVTVNPVSVVFFTTLDDPETEDINEFLVGLGQGPVNMNSGHGNLFLWSQNIAGTATVTVSAIEAVSGREFNTSFQIEVVNGIGPDQPSSVSLNNNGGVLYVNGSGGVNSQNLNITVNGGNLPVTDPQVNNIKLSLVTDGVNSGEKLTSTNVFGSVVQGTSINIGTVNGIANALVNSGSSPNAITVTATVDRADNNVDNGIQDAITIVTNYIVSDGVLWALELTSPALDSLTVNAETDTEGTINFQDGTYSLIISAVATDKGGNPALPQTLQFGMINSPIVGYPANGAGTFVHSAQDGDPQEGGTIFTSVSGGFITAAGGVQPNDTLVVFGEESAGNEDLESAVTVAAINSQTSLSIVERFNRNDETGTVNNDLGIFPYAIGRAVDGNITATAVINNFGVATTTLNYPVSQLGRIAAVFVKGQGAINNGVVKIVTDVEVTAFPGVEGFNGQSSTLVVSPNIIPGNVGNIGFVVCIADSARNPLPGRSISFSYVGGEGQGTIDGQNGFGVLDQSTNENGCAFGIVSTLGVLPGENTNELGFNFFSGTLTCDLTESDSSVCMEVVPPSNGILNANPSSFLGSGTVNITLTLFDGSGQPIEGVSIAGSCEQVDGGLLAIVSGPTATNANGQSNVAVSVGLDAPDGGLSGICTFATAAGEPSVDVNFTGGDSCVLVSPSPVPPFDSCVVDQFTVGGLVVGLTTAGPLVLQNNSSNNVIVTSDTTFTFPLQDTGSSYSVTVLTQPPGQTCTVTGGSGVVRGGDVLGVLVSCAP
ncbi:MAG: hypothetical protein JKX98_06040 [Alcanivoracaceae bacterium]|nr:hypothetical protein [Alcanivoracaceae bacterium]